MTIAYFGSDEYAVGEAWGIRLVQTAVGLLSSLRPLPASPPYVPEGPHFVFDAAPDLFLGRRGRGPLHVAWDTNLLIDYFSHGRDIWQSDGAPGVEGEYGENLDALKLLVALWVARDIRFHVLPRTLTDARRALSTDEQARRWIAFREFATAVELHAPDDETYGPTTPPLLLPDAELQRALDLLPPGADRDLVEQAFRAGAHVFLTGDTKVLRRRAELRPFGLLLASPNDLLEALGECGALLCLIEPERFLHWPFVDLDRVAHLVRALPPSGQPGAGHAGGA